MSGLFWTVRHQQIAEGDLYPLAILIQSVVCTLINPRSGRDFNDPLLRQVREHLPPITAW
jgi:hypothetical protein